MACDMTADNLKAVEDYLNREYFLVRRQVLAIVVALMAAAGLGTVGGAWLVAKQVVESTVAKKAEERIKAILAEAECDRIKVAEALAAANSDRGKITDIYKKLTLPAPLGLLGAPASRKINQEYTAESDGVVIASVFGGDNDTQRHPDAVMVLRVDMGAKPGAETAPDDQIGFNMDRDGLYGSVTVVVRRGVKWRAILQDQRFQRITTPNDRITTVKVWFIPLQLSMLTDAKAE